MAPRYSMDIDNSRTKKLVVCCDGTWMDSDGGHTRIPSNVTRLARAIKPADSEKNPQIVYYQAGIGTGMGLWSQFIGGGTGMGFSENVREAYAFLANNYHCDTEHPALSDRIFLIGFSRGAYTARSLGGLVGQLGLLTKESMCWFYEVFSDWQNAGNPDHKPEFWDTWNRYNEKMGRPDRYVMKKQHGSVKGVDEYLNEYRTALLAHKLTQEADVSAIGVFDTVGALGVPINPIVQKMFNLPRFLHLYKWVDTNLDKHIKNAFQALALDEHRAPFFPCVWERTDEGTTNLKQVWFAGAHSSIGGAYTDIAQANITLAWMMDQLSGWEQKRDKRPDWTIDDWLEFDVDYLKEQRDLNLADQAINGGERSWGMGAIYNSLSLSMLVAGSRTRRPGRTHPTIYPWEREDNERLLRNTNERIHSSVRVRIVRAGNDFEKDPAASLIKRVGLAIASGAVRVMHKITRRDGKVWYQSHVNGSLKGWKLKDGKPHDDYSFDPVINPEEKPGRPPEWEWQGQDSLLTKGTVIKEDRLGHHELILLREYKEISNWVEASNLGAKSVDDAPDVKRDSVQHSATL